MQPSTFDIFEQLEQQDDLASTLAVFGIVNLKIGNLNLARKYLQEAWEICYETRGFIPSSFTLTLMALCLLDQIEIERAVEVYAAISRYPMAANSPWFEDVAGREIREAASALSSETVVAAQERGRAGDPYAIAEGYLDIVLKAS